MDQIGFIDSSFSGLGLGSTGAATCVICAVYNKTDKRGFLTHISCQSDAGQLVKYLNLLDPNKNASLTCALATEYHDQELYREVINILAANASLQNFICDKTAHALTMTRDGEFQFGYEEFKDGRYVYKDGV